MLSLPVLKFKLLPPRVLTPVAVLLLPVVLLHAPEPMAVLLMPVVLAPSAERPFAVLSLPEVLLKSVPPPVAVLPFRLCC